MLRFTRFKAAALTGAAVLALLVVTAGSASAARTPVPHGPDAEAGARLFAAHLPAPGSAAQTAKPFVFTLTTSGKSTGRATPSVTITCTSSSGVLASPIGGYFSVLGQATSSCPAPVDYISAQVFIYAWSADLGEWYEIGTGNLTYLQPYVTPGVNVTSESIASCEGTPYQAIGFHQARLGSSYATGYSSGGVQSFSFC